MYDAGCLSDAAPLQRARGELRVSLKLRDGATVLDRLRQAGCLKARFPRGAVPGWAEVVMLNTSGGIAAGDRLESSFVVQSGAQATIAGQAAERHYRASVDSAPAQVRTHIAVGADAAAEWLPQETILFDRCAMDRRLEVDLADSARFTGVETLVFGRAAMGERVTEGRLRDLIRIRRGGRVLLHDAVRLHGAVDALLQRPAIACGARCFATLLHVAPGAAQMVDGVRAVLAGRRTESGVSAWEGMLVTRLLAADAAALRDGVVAALHVLREARPLPRVWLC